MQEHALNQNYIGYVNETLLKPKHKEKSRLFSVCFPLEGHLLSFLSVYLSMTYSVWGWVSPLRDELGKYGTHINNKRVRKEKRKLWPALSFTAEIHVCT